MLSICVCVVPEASYKSTLLGEVCRLLQMYGTLHVEGGAPRDDDAISLISRRQLDAQLAPTRGELPRLNVYAYTRMVWLVHGWADAQAGWCTGVRVWIERSAGRKPHACTHMHMQTCVPTALSVHTYTSLFNPRLHPPLAEACAPKGGQCRVRTARHLRCKGLQPGYVRLQGASLACALCDGGRCCLLLTTHHSPRTMNSLLTHHSPLTTTHYSLLTSSLLTTTHH